jgi:hypothetical protein
LDLPGTVVEDGGFFDWVWAQPEPVTDDQARRALDICLLDEGHEGPHEFDGDAQNSAQNPGIEVG